MHHPHDAGILFEHLLKTMKMLRQICLILPIMKTTIMLKKKQGQYILWMVINHCDTSTRTFICANGTAVFGRDFLQIQSYP